VGGTDLSVAVDDDLHRLTVVAGRREGKAVLGVERVGGGRRRKDGECEHGDGERCVSLEDLPPDAAERLLAELTSRLIAVERDLVHFPVVYYFSAADPRFSLPVAAPYLLELALRGTQAGRPEVVRLRATLLLAAIHDFAVTTARRYYGAEASGTGELLRAYARDHLAAER